MRYLAGKLVGAVLLAIDIPLGYAALDTASKGNYAAAAYIGAIALIPFVLGSGFLAASFEGDENHIVGNMTHD